MAVTLAPALSVWSQPVPKSRAGSVPHIHISNDDTAVRNLCLRFATARSRLKIGTAWRDAPPHFSVRKDFLLFGAAPERQRTAVATTRPCLIRGRPNSGDE